MAKVTGKVTPPTDNPQETGLWVRKRINVVKDDGGLHPVDARCMGPLAVHLSITGTGNWCISHARIGRILTYVGKQADAMRVVEELLADPVVASAVRKVERSALIAGLPSWVVPWLYACREATRYVPPTEYKDG